MILGIIMAVIGVAGAVIAYRKVQMDRIINSPHLSIGEWTLHRLPDRPPSVACKVMNTGGTPATICESIFGYDIRGKYLSEPIKSAFTEVLESPTIGAKDYEIIRRLLPLNSDSWPLVEREQLDIIVFASVTYKGKWIRQTHVSSHQVYDTKMEAFSTVGYHQSYQRHSNK